jgi:hypothetical protein
VTDNSEAKPQALNDSGCPSQGCAVVVLRHRHGLRQSHDVRAMQHTARPLLLGTNRARRSLTHPSRAPPWRRARSWCSPPRCCWLRAPRAQSSAARSPRPSCARACAAGRDAAHDIALRAPAAAASGSDARLHLFVVAPHLHLADACTRPPRSRSRRSAARATRRRSAARAWTSCSPPLPARCAKPARHGRHGAMHTPVDSTRACACLRVLERHGSAWA